MIFHTLKMCTTHFVHISYFLSYFWWVLNLDIFPSERLRGCLVCVICNSNSIHYFIFKLCFMVVHTLKMFTSYFGQISFFFTFLTDFQVVFIPFYSNFVLWLFTHWTCTPYIYANLILYFWVFNLEIVKSPSVDYIVKFGCNLISFLYIWTLHIDCSHTDVHRRRRSRAEFGLVYHGNQNERNRVRLFTLMFPTDKKVHFFVLFYAKLGRNWVLKKNEKKSWNSPGILICHFRTNPACWNQSAQLQRLSRILKFCIW